MEEIKIDSDLTGFQNLSGLNQILSFKSLILTKANKQKQVLTVIYLIIMILQGR